MRNLGLGDGRIMTCRTRARWQKLTLCAVVGFAVTRAAPVDARSSFTIPECVSAYNLRATIDPKKPDAAKQRQVDRLMRLCQQKIDEEKAKGPAQGAAPIRPQIVHTPRPVNTPPPPPPQRPNAQPVRRPPWDAAPSPAPASPQSTTHTFSLGDMLNRLKRAPAAPPASPPAPPPRAAAPAAPPAAAPAPAPAPAPVAPVVFTPPAASTEQRNIFGIQLGEALTLPACAPGVINAGNAHAFESTSKTKPRSVTESCSQAGPSVQKLAQRMADAEGKPIPAGVQFALVRLAEGSCPDWMSGGCTLSVALRSGCSARRRVPHHRQR